MLGSAGKCIQTPGYLVSGFVLTRQMIQVPAQFMKDIQNLGTVFQCMPSLWIFGLFLEQRLKKLDYWGHHFWFSLKSKSFDNRNTRLAWYSDPYSTYPENFVPNCEVTFLNVFLTDVRFVNVGDAKTLSTTFEKLKQKQWDEIHQA